MLMSAALAGCGGCDDNPGTPDAPPTTVDMAPPQCLPQGAIGAFYRRPPNPRIVAGTQTFTGGTLDTAIADPDLHWDEAGQQWRLYYQSPHGTFAAPGPMIIRHATSTNLAQWTFDQAPALALGGTGAWDRTHVEAPTVVYNPSAPADRRYLMLYSGASQMFPQPGYTFPDFAIGAAFSADGRTFTRVPASESPHGQAGLVLTGAQAYPGALDATVSDPELVLVGGVYHLWFSSFACSGASCATIDASGIGHATSTDGVTWTIDAAPVPSLLRASADARTGGQQPSAIYDPLHCRWEMWLTSDSPPTENDNQPIELHNMVGVWHATSQNGTSWSINYLGTRDLTWNASADGEHLGLRSGADIAAKGTGRYMVYVGFDDQNVPTGSTLPDRTQAGARPGVMTLNLATRDAPP
jgi:hypothetical protein